MHEKQLSAAASQENRRKLTVWHEYSSWGYYTILRMILSRSKELFLFKITTVITQAKMPPRQPSNSAYTCSPSTENRAPGKKAPVKNISVKKPLRKASVKNISVKKLPAKKAPVKTKDRGFIITSAVLYFDCSASGSVLYSHHGDSGSSVSSAPELHGCVAATLINVSYTTFNPCKGRLSCLKSCR